MELSGNAGDVEVGVYACKHTIENAVNPCISVEGIGPIGLPLSPRDAEAIVKPFDSTPDTVQSPMNRHISEIPAANLTFANPQWKDFVDTTAHKICTQLSLKGVKIEGSYICVLDRMLIYTSA
jgi:hypothetical protein